MEITWCVDPTKREATNCPCRNLYRDLPKSKYRFTVQREDATIGLYFYNARFYDPLLGRFVQPDTIVPEPGNPQSLNRYSYTLNNPIRYTDPSGHAQVCADGDEGGGCGAGANTAHIWQTFAGRRSPLLDYYAILHQLTQAQANRASAVELEALAGAADSAYAAGSAWLPQHQFDPAVVVEPASLVSLGGAITSGGMRAMRAAGLGAQSSLEAPGGSNPWGSNTPLESTVVGSEGMTVYRAHGEGRAKGAWVSPHPIPNQQYVRESLAVKAEWNPATYASEIWLPPGTRIQSGMAGSQGFGYPGGGVQMQILNPTDIAKSVVIRTWQLPR